MPVGLVICYIFLSVNIQIQTNVVVDDIDGLVMNLTGDEFRGRVADVSNKRK